MHVFPTLKFQRFVVDKDRGINDLNVSPFQNGATNITTWWVDLLICLKEIQTLLGLHMSVTQHKDLVIFFLSILQNLSII
jgi:hypothetical protein